MPGPDAEFGRSDASRDLRELVDSHLRSAATSWSIGAYGAIAEFHREAGEPVELRDLCAVTGRGAVAVRILPGCRAVAHEQGVALCLPEPQARAPARNAVAGLGPDREALRAQDREALLFDLGLGLANCEFCVRTEDAALAGALRAAESTPLLGNAPLLDLLKRASPHRVVRSRLGRIEVFQEIAAEGARSPSGPHTHLLPRLLLEGRTYAAGLPIPGGWLPCLSLHPPGSAPDGDGAR